MSCGRTTEKQTSKQIKVVDDDEYCKTVILKLRNISVIFLFSLGSAEFSLCSTGFPAFLVSAVSVSIELQQQAQGLAAMIAGLT